MRTIVTDVENTSVVEEPQLAVKFYSKTKTEKKEQKGNQP